MPLSERSARRVADTLSELTAEYGDGRVVDDTWRTSREYYDRTLERFRAGTVGGAGAWIRRDGAVLLVRDVGNEGWCEPGGKDEPGESLPAAAVRETREEAGVEVSIEGIELAERVRIVPDDGTALALHRLIVVFAATYEGGEVRPADGEVAEARWWERRPDDLLYEALEELSIERECSA